jgi:hypothetical protein
VDKLEGKEEVIEQKMEVNDAPLDGNGVDDLSTFRETINADIKKGDSTVIAILKKEIDLLKKRSNY